MQQVNLYLPELRPKKELFSAVNVAASVFLLAAILVSISMANYSAVNKIDEQLTARKIELEKLQKMTDLLKKKSRKNNKVSLERQIAKLQKLLDKKYKVIQAFDGQQLGNDQGFSAYLAGMAQQSNQKISLQRFRLSLGGQVVEIMGESINPEDAFEYVDRLIKQVEFSEANFGTLELTDLDSGLVQFSSGALANEAEKNASRTAFNGGVR